MPDVNTEGAGARDRSLLLRLLPGAVAARLAGRPGLRRIVDNIGWLFVDKILRMGVGLLVGLWVARYLGPEQFGQLNFVIAFVGMFAVIAELGLASIVVRELVREPASAPGTIATTCALQLASASVAVLAALAAITILRADDATVRLMVGVLALGLLCKSADVIKYWFESQVRSRYVVWVENGAFLLLAAVKVGLIVGGAGLMAFVWAGLAEACLAAIGLLLLHRALGGRIPLRLADTARARYLLKESWPLLLAGLAVILYMRIDVVMLQQMAGGHEVGIYAAATRVSEILYFLPGVVVASVSPTLLRLHRELPPLYASRLRQLYFFLSWLAIGIALVFSFFAGEIVELLFGASYRESAPVLVIHVWATPAVFLGVASSQYLLAEGRQKISFYRTLIGLVLNVLLNLLLIPPMGAKGAAIATLISYYAATLSVIFFPSTRRHAFSLVCAPINMK